MSQKGKTTSLVERIEIGERSQAGQSDMQIAQAMGRPLSTVKKWRRRYEREGRSGMSSCMGRPARGALGQFSAEMRETILTMRKSCPGWGALTLRLELAKDMRFEDQPLPSRSRIAAYLKQEKQVRKYERHEDLPEPKALPVEHPHQEWELDAQGQTLVAGIGKVSFINLLDVFSHLSIDSQACLHSSHPNTLDYQLVLRRGFARYGLPELISLDHDSVFYDNHSASPFPTPIHLWLIALGVQVRFIHKKPPLEHARIERHHQTVSNQAITGQTFANDDHLQDNLQGRIVFLNQEYPSQALQGQPPLKAYPQAVHSGRPYHPEWEREALDMQRVYDYLAKGRWFRLTSTVGMFSLGAQAYNSSTRFANQTLEITFDAHTCEFIYLPETSDTPFRLPAKGLTQEALMGELFPLMAFPNYQLALPFSPQAWREMSLCQVLSGTTL
jgi:transposase